jgi:PIN like domain
MCPDIPRLAPLLTLKRQARVGICPGQDPTACVWRRLGERAPGNPFRSGSLPDMASLREQFEHFYSPDDDAVSTALRTGLVAPDTNVLLSLYRFQSEGREELFGALERLGDRLWIPYQVAFEFHRNRLSVIAGQESYFGKNRDELNSTINEYLSKLKTFSNRIALPQTENHQLQSMIQQAHAAVLAQISTFEEINEIHLNNRDSDDVLARLEVLFSNRVGEPMKPEELEAARKEADKRVKAKIPPGYMDRDKPDSSGDYILWKQLMNEASLRKLPTILITDDRKEDWFRREHGLTLGARFELREEMAIEAGVPFLIMTSETFLVHAKAYLEASVSSATVDQAKELRDSLELDRLSSMGEAYRVTMDKLLAERASMNDRSVVLVDRTKRLQDEFDRMISEYRGRPPREIAKALGEQLDVLQTELDAHLTREEDVSAEITRMQAAVQSLGDELDQLS